MLFPKDLKYNKEHTWLKLEGDNGRVGITDFDHDQLKEIPLVQLPDIGTEVKYMEPFGVVESAKSVNDLYSPVSGEVIAVNSSLENEPTIVNQSPYDKGWMVLIKIKDKSEISSLISAEDYQAFIGV